MSDLVSKAFVKIDNHGVLVNGRALWSSQEQLDERAYFKQLYEVAGLDYPKYFKMDSLCKLGLVAAELLFKEQNLPELYAKDRVGIVLQCKAASLETDRKFYDTIKDAESYFPSPAVFVYTLPSIVMGEISIKHGLQGENAMLVADDFNLSQVEHTAQEMLDSNRVDACLVGWVNADLDNFSVLMYTLEPEQGGMHNGFDMYGWYLDSTLNNI